MQKLILLAGEAWTGKSSCADQLYQRFSNSAWLDGDDVWRVNPFSVSDKRLRNSDLNMAFVIDNYLKCNFDYVFFSSIVLCDKGIREKILNLLTAESFEIIFITLFASESELRLRAKKRDLNIDPQFLLLAESLQQDSIFVDTTEKKLPDVVDEIMSHIN